ncbi:MAG: bifunctional adenosylcobinamide kinase/adenosylcobinamide-phosphate guanylyltransferase, partial [Acidobacteriaceae bacterium]|nr:bifunctional adenosylcobinamide kinase/adenosylcobinamide-phosphate guanylyltransferase [Acidobacteriaceae bacterium]
LHRKQRPASWVTIEERIAVPAVIAEHAPKTEVVLVDCLTLWLSNLLYEWRDDDTATLQRKAREQTAEFTDACNSGKVIAVTNEVGSGIVPESALARRFRDVHGFMNQQMARAAAEVYLLVSGIPLRIKAVT